MADAFQYFCYSHCIIAIHVWLYFYNLFNIFKFFNIWSKFAVFYFTVITFHGYSELYQFWWSPRVRYNRVRCINFSLILSYIIQGYKTKSLHYFNDNDAYMRTLWIRSSQPGVREKSQRVPNYNKFKIVN